MSNLTDSQKVHIGMINSFNLITNRVHLEDIIESDVPLFAHNPEDDIDLKSLDLMVMYFQSLEMFERCGEIMKYINKHYTKDGKLKIKLCECEYPEIEVYTKKLKCSTCKKRISK